jgi:hypothetical protein
MNAIGKLDLRPGEWIEVRGEAEILATLDDDGTLDGLPFMPEMLAHCGQRYRVYKRADKTCDTVNWTGLRRMENTVHVTMLRCDGSAHGGCQAGCLMFWKEAWLRRSPAGDAQAQGRDDFLCADDRDEARCAGDRDGVLRAGDRDGVLCAGDRDGVLCAGDRDGVLCARRRTRRSATAPGWKQPPIAIIRAKAKSVIGVRPRN